MLPQTHDSIVIRTEYRVDSVWRDRWHTERIKGDTVFIHDSIFFGEYKNKEKADTICVRDSISYPVEVQVPVHERNAYDRFTSWGFWILLVISLLIIAWKIAKKYIKAQTGGTLSIITKLLQQ